MAPDTEALHGRVAKASHVEEALTILHVEDDPDQAALIAVYLRRQQPDVRVAQVASVAEAARYLDSQPCPDVVLCDLQLPDGTGLEVLTHVRGRDLPAAVLMLSASPDETAAVAALRAGVDHYLTKSRDYLDQLSGAVAAALLHRQQVNEISTPRLRVLYAEHHTQDIELTRAHLARWAPHVDLQVCRSAEELLSRLDESPDAAERFDVLLLDYRLPGLDAIEAARVIRFERKLSTPVVLVTGSGDPDLAGRAIQAGVSDYLSKHASYLFELPLALEKVSQRSARELERRRLKHVLMTSPTVLYVLAKTQEGLRTVWTSDNVQRVTGYRPEELRVSGWWSRGLHPKDKSKALVGFARLWHTGHEVLQYRFLHADGRVLWIRDELRVVYDADGEVLEVVGCWNDITEQYAAQSRLRLDAAAFASMRDAVIITDARSCIVAVNAAFTAMTQYPEAEVIGHNPRILSSGRQDAGFYGRMWQAVMSGGHWSGEVWDRRRDGSLLPVHLSISQVRSSDDEVTNYVGVLTDISDVKLQQAEREWLAHHDVVTKLPNRLLLEQHLERALAEQHASGQKVALLFLDLDRFKTVNDSLGHHVGDAVLVAFAERMQPILGERHYLARFGGDEFMVVVRPCDAGELEDIALSIMKAMGPPLKLSTGHEVYLSVSLGIGVAPDNARTVGELIQAADVALHSAKEAGRETHRYHSAQLAHRAIQRLQLESRLRRALEREELCLHYQPIVSLETGRIAGVESLVRWNSPDAGLISPGEFIPVAEESGLIGAIGDWVLRRACSDFKRWLDGGADLDKLAVNLSVRQFSRPEIVGEIAAILDETGLDPGRLELEITETGVMEQGRSGFRMLKRLKGLGVRLAIDDFGTGYSSLVYLKRFPIDTLKVDKSFVQDLGQDRFDEELVRMIVGLGRRLDLQVVGEGVESDEQKSFLRGCGCHFYQGYLFSRPLPADELARLITGATEPD